MTPEVSSLSIIQIFDNAVNALWRPHKKYLSLDYISLNFLDFLYHLKYCVKEHQGSTYLFESLL